MVENAQSLLTTVTINYTTILHAPLLNLSGEEYAYLQ